ncbi:MAG TPA: PilZ domain-containing protein [Phycisphaerales bacterium]|nr:PilZ domain-containing protein [Phycisphaerales bacterium]
MPPRVRLTDNERGNTLGLSRRDLDELIAEIEIAQRDDPGVHRRFRRRQYRQLALALQVHQPGGSTSTFPVVSRNISRTGMAVLHRAYIHLGVRVQVALPRRAAATLSVSAHVVRCRHVSGMVHEIGLQFDHPIQLRDLVDLELNDDWLSLETVEPATLVGSVLLADPSAEDRGLLRGHLRGARLSITEAETPEAALAAAARPNDLIITEYFFGGRPAEDLLLSLRQLAPRTPLLVLTADVSEVTRRRLGTLGAASLLKPVDELTALRAIGEFLGAGGPAGAKASGLARTA